MVLINRKMAAFWEDRSLRSDLSVAIDKRWLINPSRRGLLPVISIHRQRLDLSLSEVDLTNGIRTITQKDVLQVVGKDRLQEAQIAPLHVVLQDRLVRPRRRSG